MTSFTRFFSFLKGDRHASTAHDHVILPKQLTDDFYSTWTQCYEELFHASLSPKYIQRKESTASTLGRPTSRYGLHHSVSEMNLASGFNDGYSSGGARPRNKQMHRLSLDVSNMNLDFTPDEHPYRRHQRHLSDSESSMRSSNERTSNLAKFFGRKKVYKLSDTTSSATQSSSAADYKLG